MEQSSKGCKADLAATSKMLVLDFLFGEGHNMQAYQLVRFARGEAWNILSDGILLASLDKNELGWSKVTGDHISQQMIERIGSFIDSQHFNTLPSKIKCRWQEYIADVIMQNDSLYLVIALPNINFGRFKNVFRAFVNELVEDPWPILFKVYNADFSDEFVIKVIQ